MSRFLFVLCLVVAAAHADLTVDDLDLFDVVEDVKQNFYEFLEIAPNSTSADVRKAYRRLSLLYHPDKNSDPDAPEKFRKIASVVEVLRDEKKRAKYHEVLEYGIPDWARSMYYRYYRKARKMGSLEMSVLMSIIVTVAQTLWMYASYWEKKFTINSNVDEAIKRKRQRSTNSKKNKAAEEEIRQMREELMSHITAPTFFDIWFVRLPIVLFHGLLALPAVIKQSLEKKEIPIQENSDEEEEIIVKPKRTPRQRTEVKGAQVVTGTAPVVSSGSNKHKEQKQLNTGPWTDSEVSYLTRLLRKFPVGTQDRWEKIGEALNRSAADVLDKNKSLQSMTAANNVTAQQQSSNKSLWVESEISTKDEEDGDDDDGQAGGDGDDDDDDDSEPENLDPADWSQNQQKQLESAMVAFPKWTDRRWDMIADRVAGKSKRACIARVKWLIESVKKKKTGD